MHLLYWTTERNTTIEENNNMEQQQQKKMKKPPSYGLSYRHFIQASNKTIWIMYLLKIIEATSYISGSLVLKPYLMENFNFTDYEAGVAYGIYGVQISIIGVLMGIVIDKVGIRLSFLYGLFILTLARVHLSLTNNKTHLLWNLYLFLPLGTAFGIPVLFISLRRYSAKCDGGFVYSLFFVALNLGYLLGGIVVDIFRNLFVHKHEKNNIADPNKSIFQQMTAYRYINLFTAFCTFIMLVIAYFHVFDMELVYIYKDNTRKLGQNISEIPEEELEYLRSKRQNRNNNKTEKVLKSGWISQPFQNKPTRSVCNLISYMVGQAQFWTFTLLCFLLTGVRMLFRHMDATMPQFIERELGKKVNFGIILGMNPLFLVFFTMAVNVYIYKHDKILCLIIGTSITAISSLWLVFLKPSIAAIILCIVTLAVGEAIWVPKFNEYAMNTVAPIGQEGLFSALSNAPFFFVKLFTGLVSGGLLSIYCPVVGTRRSRMMWFLITLMNLTSPVLIVSFHLCKCFQERRVKTGEVELDNQDGDDRVESEDERKHLL